MSESIEEIEALRFNVMSDSRFGIVHLVDLGEQVPFGQCSCEYWRFNIGPKVRELRRKKLRRYCKHIRLAKDYVADRVVERVMEARGEK